MVLSHGGVDHAILYGLEPRLCWWCLDVVVLSARSERIRRRGRMLASDWMNGRFYRYIRKL